MKSSPERAQSNVLTQGMQQVLWRGLIAQKMITFGKNIAYPMARFTTLILLFLLYCIPAIKAQDKAETLCKNRAKQVIMGSSLFFADNSRSDSIDILNYTINLSIIDLTGKKIKGNCNILFQPKINGISYIALDLLKLTVDSVVFNNSAIPFSYNDTLIVAWFPSALSTAGSYSVIVYYRGTPQIDGGGSGWGGFYFQSGYAYNLGVGFLAEPHNFGRVWFPCFDNFVERSTYTCNIITAGNKKAVCGGVLVSEDTLSGDTIMRSWQINQQIPTYLASVAVNNYVFVTSTHNGIQGNFPVMLAALATDTTKLKNSFINLDDAILTYEYRYGPYRWDRVGFVLVPFNAGAMEHAMNIAFPVAYANGTLDGETTMAHELSHHWWGNLVTCETAGDMWINEGWATYSEFIFLEYVYGKNTFRTEINKNHLDVIYKTHFNNGGYLPLSPVSSAMTYDYYLIYMQGADVAHTLRGYLGDSLFFLCIRSFMDDYAFKNVNSYKMRDYFSNCSGVDLTGFFNGWVFNPGFPHFSIDSVRSTEGPPGQFDVKVYVKQKLTGAPAFYNDVHIDFSFMDDQWKTWSFNRVISGATDMESVSLNFNPVFSALDIDDRISDAITADSKVIKAPGNYYLHNYSPAALQFYINVKSINDSMFIRVEHNWTNPDPPQFPTIYHLNPYRYWKVDGIFPSSWSADALIKYDGNTTPDLDDYLFTIVSSEDSLVLLYRRGASEFWYEYPYYTKAIGLATDKRGNINLDSILPGEYVFAMRGDTVYEAVEEKAGGALPAMNLLVYPNPFNKSITFAVEGSRFSFQTLHIEIFDTFGRIITACSENGSSCIFNRNDLNDGVLFYRCFIDGQIIKSGKILVQ